MAGSADHTDGNFLHTPAPKGTTLGYDSMSPDFAKAETKVERHDIVGRTRGRFLKLADRILL